MVAPPYGHPCTGPAAGLRRRHSLPGQVAAARFSPAGPFLPGRPLRPRREAGRRKDIQRIHHKERRCWYSPRPAPPPISRLPARASLLQLRQASNMNSTSFSVKQLLTTISVARAQAERSSCDGSPLRAEADERSSHLLGMQSPPSSRPTPASPSGTSTSGRAARGSEPAAGPCPPAPVSERLPPTPTHPPKGGLVSPVRFWQNVPYTPSWCYVFHPPQKLLIVQKLRGLTRCDCAMCRRRLADDPAFQLRDRLRRGGLSRRRDCHFDHTPCLSILKHLTKVQGGAIK